MIRVDDKCVEIRGDKTKLVANLTQIINVLFNEEVMDKSDIDECVRVASLSEEELKAETANNFERAWQKAIEKGDLFGFLADMFGDLAMSDDDEENEDEKKD